MKKLTLALFLLGLSACAMFDRHISSGYGDYEESGDLNEDLYRQKAQHAEYEAREELGFNGRALSDEERGDLETRIKLKRRERKLTTNREKKQYFSLRPALKTDRDRLQFLSLPTVEARDRWARTRGLTSEETYSDDVAKIIESNDIALGMHQKAVMESWGDPDAVEVAGDPVYGFERWKYNRYVSGSEGYEKETRIVYFEGGRVVGWEKP